MNITLKFRKLLMLKRITRRILPDKAYYQYCYFLLFGKAFSYSNPVGFNAKIQWLKVFNRDPQMINLADKCKVREFVANKIGEEHLVPCYGSYSNAEEINWDALPGKFVLKTNHGSGFNIFCLNKCLLDQKKTVCCLNKWLKRNYYFEEKEWQYKGIKPRVLCEEYLGSGGDLLELKLFCYHGTPEFIIAYKTRDSLRNIYNRNWERLDCETTFKKGAGLEKPENLGLILNLASKLSAGFVFVRVDLLATSNGVFFGELTFTPTMGFIRFNPPEYDLVFGAPLGIPPVVKGQSGN